MSELPVRKPNRMKGYDYSQNGMYFLTLCIKDRHEMLGKINNGQLELNEYGRVVKQEIENVFKIRKECVIEKYVIMPNHIHLIVQITVGDDGNRPVNDGNRPATDGNRPAVSWADCHHAGGLPSAPTADCMMRADCHPPLRRSVSNMVQGLKGAVTRQIGFSLWQRSFHDHIIRNDQDYARIVEYIDNNPANWEQDCFWGGNNR
jgi:REP element-mobilizing transposase RayT